MRYIHDSLMPNRPNPGQGPFVHQHSLEDADIRRLVEALGYNCEEDPRGWHWWFHALNCFCLHGG